MNGQRIDKHIGNIDGNIDGKVIGNVDGEILIKQR